jgi:HEAT repeat protein
VHREDDPAILAALCGALADESDVTMLGPLIQLSTHPNPEVRLAATMALHGYDEPEAVATLIRLSADEHDDVRDWATAALGSLEGIGMPEVRRALHARLADPHDDTRGEALNGLARRKDLSIVDNLLAELARDDVGPLIVDAAGNLGDHRLHAALVQVRERWRREDVIERHMRALDEAIDKCDGGPDSGKEAGT